MGGLLDLIITMLFVVLLLFCAYMWWDTADANYGIGMVLCGMALKK